ncbi:MAG: hypothetical protein HY648_00105 [Acidobacteria bacterium]|nr:hypothetical protein [Acidobacteriota bacterium]
MRNQWRWVVLLLFGLPWSAGAQETNSDRQMELLGKLLARIERLEARVEELEQRPKLSLANARVELAHMEPAGLSMQAMEAMPGMQAGQGAESTQFGAQAGGPSAIPGADTQLSQPSLRLSGFSDFNFSATDQSGSRSGFTEGQFALHVTSALSSKVNFFGEVSATARPDAGTGTPAATGFNFEVERSIIRFDQSDRFKASFGRYHTPVNWWNTAFHHGQWLQTSISRPEMTQFGGRLIPVHFVGGLAEGALALGGLNLNYNAGLGNGRGSVISRGGDAGDNNNQRAWLVNLFAKPDRLFGLVAGGSVYHDKITLAGGREFREWITSAHIVWQKENPELIAEFANVHHKEIGRENSFNSQAYYIQLAYRLPWFESHWKPYYRFEYIHIPRGDAVFQGVPNLAGSVAGLRYDISSYAAIKAEYRNQRRLAGQPRVNGGFLQTSFTF